MNAPRRTQEERREATRDALLTAALALVAERGIEATTLQDVAERAGVSKGALTHHYENKDALLDAVLDRAATPVERALTAAWDPTAAPLPRLRKALAALGALAEGGGSDLKVLTALAAAGGHDARLGGLVRARIEALEATFAEGLSFTLAELGARPRVAPASVARALVASALGAALRPGERPGDAQEVRRLWEAAVLAIVDPFES